MPMYSYDLQNVKRDLSDTMNTVVKDEPIFISKFPRVGDSKTRSADAASPRRRRPPAAC